MSEAGGTTVGQYLTRRLEQAGLRHVFGVPGDYALRLFDCLQESRMKLVITCNELNAGYAADAYARLNGVGAVAVTYGVGGFSLFNAVVGAFAERVPLIVVSGAPRLHEREHHHLLHHTVGDMNLQYEMYEKITVASTVLTSAEQAPDQIDKTIAACLRYKRPVYIEAPTDIVAKPCREPGEFKPDTAILSNRHALDEAADEAAAMLTRAKNPAILAGVEIHRLGLRDDLVALLDRTGYPYATTLLGKAVVPEQHPQFVGVYIAALGGDYPRRMIEDADALLSLGALMTDVNLGIQTARLEAGRMIVANSDKVRIKHHLYPHVSLKDFIRELRARLPQLAADPRIEHPSRALRGEFAVAPDAKITVKRFYPRLNRFVNPGHVVLADTGDSIFGAGEMFMPGGLDFLGQAFYMSIGFAVPGTLGAMLAAPERRAVTFVGDGAFQMTGQELSTIIRHRLNPVILLLNNDGYTIERVLRDGPYNDVQAWKYHRLPEVYGGGWGCEVRTEGELEAALQKADRLRNELAFIEVHLDRWDYTDGLRKLGEIFNRK